MRGLGRRGGPALLIVSLLLSGCGSFNSPDPGKGSASALEQRWILIKNPRFGIVEGERQYIWVREGQIPLTLNSIVFGEEAVLAPRETTARYGSPPEGGQISPRQGGPPVITSLEDAQRPGTEASVPQKSTKTALIHPVTGEFLGTVESSPKSSASDSSARGYVIYVGEGWVVVDLTARDGMTPGTLLTLYREEIKLAAPGLGPASETRTTIGVVQVTEVRDRFSLADVAEVTPGLSIQVKDRVAVQNNQ